MDLSKVAVKKDDSEISPIIEDQKVILSQKRGKPIEVVLKPNKKPKTSVITSESLEKIKKILKFK